MTPPACTLTFFIFHSERTGIPHDLCILVPQVPAGGSENTESYHWSARECIGIHSKFELQVGTTLVNTQTHTQLSQSLQGSLNLPQAHQGDISETVLS